MNSRNLIDLYIGAVADSQETERSYQQILISFVDYIGSVADLSFEKYVEWKKLVSDKAATTQKKYIAVTKGFVNWCFDNFNMGDASQLLKISHVKPPRGNSKPTEPLKPEQIRKMLSVAKNHRERAIISLLASTGMRISELINLKIDDIKEDGILVKGKGNKYRFVYPSQESITLVQKYVDTMRAKKIKEKSIKTDLLFLSNTGEKMNSVSLNNTWKKLAEMCGVDINIHNHTFRHSTASIMLEKGVPIDSVQSILGHSDISTTKIYAVKSTQQIRKDIAMINVF